MNRRVLGPDHPNTLVNVHTLGTAHRALGNYAEAERYLREAWAGRRRVLGEENPITLLSLNSLGWVYEYQQQWARADDAYSRVLAIRRRTLGSRNPDTLVVASMLAHLRLLRSQFSAAESLGRETVTAYQQTAPDQWRRFFSEVTVGAALSGQGRYAEAEPLLVSAYDGLIQRSAAITAEQRKPLLAESRDYVVRLYERWGKSEKAAEWRQKSPGDK